jgi:hypothetical protein
MTVKRKRLILPALLLLAVASTSLALVSGHNGSIGPQQQGADTKAGAAAPTPTAAPTPSATPVPSPTPAPSATPSPAQVRAILITVKPDRIEPAQLTLPAGEYLLVVENRSGVRDTTFRFDTGAGQRLVEVHDPLRRLDWRRQLDLGAGSYTLSEAAHPQWSCRITVTQAP